MKKDMLERVPPHNIEAEQAVIVAMMLNTYAVDTVLQMLTEDDFYDEKNRILFKAISTVRDSNMAVDIVTVSEQLKATGDSDKIGGTQYLHKLLERVPSITNSGHYCQIVMGKSILRNLINTCSNIVDNIYAYPSEVTRLLDEAEQSVIDTANRKYKEDRNITVKNSVKDVLQRTYDMAEGKIPYYGIFTGYKKVDEILGGFLPGNLVIIAGSFGGGKTALAVKIMLNMYDQTGKDIPILYFTLEMKEDEITKRMLSLLSRVNYTILRRPRYLTAEHKTNLQDAANELEKHSIIINDTARLNIMSIKAITRRMWRKNKIRVVFIDHLQIVGLERNGESRNDRLGDVSAGLKELAKELNIVVVLLSQLNKEGGVRDSANPEQDADIVMKLQRDGDKAKLKLTKARESKLGEIDMIFRGDYMEFEEAEYHNGGW